MTIPDPDSAWQVRPPWPDEIDRLPGVLRSLLSQRGARRLWLWVLVADTAERIVGAALLAERDPASTTASPTGRIDLAFLPAWKTRTPAVAALLAAASAQADTLALRPLEVQASLDTPASDWLVARGFHPQNAQEVWRLPLALNIARRLPAIDRALARRPVEVRALDETTLPAVRAVCAAHGLLSPERVVLARENQEGLDPRLSFVAAPSPLPAAVLLARFARRQAYLEVLARRPDAPDGGPEIGALLRAFFLGARDLGTEEILCVIRCGRAQDTLRLLRRAHAERIERFAAFVRDTSAPSAPQEKPPPSIK